MSTKALKISWCMTARSTAEVPPAEKPATPHCRRSALAPKFEVMNGTTSLVK